MGIEHRTPWPSRYADEPDEWRAVTQARAQAAYWARYSPGKYYLRAETAREGSTPVGTPAAWRREAALQMGRLTNEKPAFDRRRKVYTAGGWEIGDDGLASRLFCWENRDGYARALAGMREAGYGTGGMVGVHYVPETEDVGAVLALAERLKHSEPELARGLKPTDEVLVMVDRSSVAVGLLVEKCPYELLETTFALLRRETARLARREAM